MCFKKVLCGFNGRCKVQLVFIQKKRENNGLLSGLRGQLSDSCGTVIIDSILTKCSFVRFMYIYSIPSTIHSFLKKKIIM